MNYRIFSKALPALATLVLQCLCLMGQSYQWDFGDGITGWAEKSPIHTYEKAGVYRWTLRVTHTNGEVQQREGSITVYPIAPTSLAATVTAVAVSSSEVSLTWSYSGTAIDGFRVQRKKAGDNQWSDLGDLPASTLSFEEQGLDAGSVYSYRVLAYSGDLFSRPSDEFSLTTFAPYYAPVIVSQPVSTTVTAGQRAPLRVTGAGSELTYQWYRLNGEGNWEAIEDATFGTYDTPPMTAPQSYLVRLTNALANVESETVRVGVTETAAEQPHKFYLPFARLGPADADLFNGIAVCQPDVGLRDTGVTFKIYQSTGALAGVPYNPVGYNLAGPQQLARLTTELTGTPPATESYGWAEVTSSSPIASFWQLGRSAALDGAQPVKSASRRLYFTRVYEGGGRFRGYAARTLISIANVSDRPVEVRVRLLDESGHEVTSKLGQDTVLAESNLTIPARGSFAGPISRLFGVPAKPGRGYIVAETFQEEDSLIGASIVEVLDAETLIVLNAVSSQESTKLHSAQLARTSGLFTSLKFLNTSGETRRITLRATDEQGALLFDEQTLELGPGCVVEKDADVLFDESDDDEDEDDDAAEFIGSLTATVDGPGVIGDVLFGDSTALQSAAALPLQSKVFTQAVFGHVANGLGLFTGLALFNPGSAEAHVTVEVHAADGTKVGTANVTLASGHRLARTLPELVPASDGLVGGYVVLKSEQPIVAQQMFGSETMLSAVPAEPIEASGAMSGAENAERW